MGNEVVFGGGVLVINSGYFVVFSGGCLKEFNRGFEFVVGFVWGEDIVVEGVLLGGELGVDFEFVVKVIDFYFCFVEGNGFVDGGFVVG